MRTPSTLSTYHQARSNKLPAQIHTPLPIQLPKERGHPVLDEVNGLTGAVHFHAQIVAITATELPHRSKKYFIRTRRRSKDSVLSNSLRKRTESRSFAIDPSLRWVHDWSCQTKMTHATNNAMHHQGIGQRLRYILRSPYTCLKKGSFRSLMK